MSVVYSWSSDCLVVYPLGLPCAVKTEYPYGWLICLATGFEFSQPQGFLFFPTSLPALRCWGVYSGVKAIVYLIETNFLSQSKRLKFALTSCLSHTFRASWFVVGGGTVKFIIKMFEKFGAAIVLFTLCHDSCGLNFIVLNALCERQVIYICTDRVCIQKNFPKQAEVSAVNRLDKSCIRNNRRTFRLLLT